eukprot:TRINITY_DN66660_c0_g1_i1.p1 TRINITY_DN66660_c0_g1~~TRINITY_DN66660_c0_g1_i1.p1  ORF type:complete len:482 (-),score=74.78 TRINITY_DN66660_c0_g1_i1:160-1605(-)
MYGYQGPLPGYRDYSDLGQSEMRPRAGDRGFAQQYHFRDVTPPRRPEPARDPLPQPWGGQPPPISTYLGPGTGGLPGTFRRPGMSAVDPLAGVGGSGSIRQPNWTVGAADTSRFGGRSPGGLRASSAPRWTSGQSEGRAEVNAFPVPKLTEGVGLHTPSMRQATRKLSLASEQALGQLAETSRDLLMIERRVGEVESLVLDSDGRLAPLARIPPSLFGTLGDVRSELAQLESRAKQLEGSKIDSVYTSELTTGKEAAREEKKSMLKRLEQLFVRFERVFRALKELQAYEGLAGKSSQGVHIPAPQSQQFPESPLSPGTGHHPFSNAAQASGQTWGASPRVGQPGAMPHGMPGQVPVVPSEEEVAAATMELQRIERRLLEVEGLISGGALAMAGGGMRGAAAALSMDQFALARLREELIELEFRAKLRAAQLTARAKATDGGLGHLAEQDAQEKRATYLVKRVRSLFTYLDSALERLERQGR